MATFFNWVPWLAMGDVANVGQLVGINAVQLISMIVKAANNARMHKKNCRQFAQHLSMIGNLLEQLNLTDLKRRPECKEPLEHLEQALRKAKVLVDSCCDKSYLYLVAMGWVYVNKFRDYQDEIDRYLNLIPLISLVEKHRERLREITKDKRLYTMEDSEVKMRDTLWKPERTKRDSLRLSKQLSRRYPGVPLNFALREENVKLRKELEHMRVCRELGECNVIERLIDFTETAAADPVILQEAMSQIAEEDEDEAADRPSSKHHLVKESSNRHVKHPKPSFVTLLTRSSCMMELQGKILPTDCHTATEYAAAATKSMTGIMAYAIVALMIPAYVLKLSATPARHLLSLPTGSQMARPRKTLRAINWRFIRFIVAAVATLVAYDERSANDSISRVIAVGTTGRMSVVAVVQFFKNFTSFVIRRGKLGQQKTHHQNRRWRTTDDLYASNAHFMVPRDLINCNCSGAL